VGNKPFMQYANQWFDYGLYSTQHHMQILLFGGPNATEFSAQGFDTRGCDHFALSNHPNKM
jgi:hypothetical protein